jgi:DNA primase catalytic subunit
MSSVTPLITQMYRWLSYGNDPHGTSPLTDKTYFVRREMSFTIANDIYIRYQCFKDKEDMIQQIQKMKVCHCPPMPWCSAAKSVWQFAASLSNAVERA